jgi:hypothetical protein
VFAPTQRRKIILATNIAETSLTIPGIRFVVDTGLARLSRYSPQARTRRLPIEPVAQSSADQRKGRAGRVAEGVCIRLYSEQDYLERPRFTQPEIQRANLADVILRLKAFGLGDIERFPFLNPPAAKAIRAGYALLEELGALEIPANWPPDRAGLRCRDPHQLTPIGRELARLPVDPTVGRMILQARGEKCLREVLAIAAGLSIQDPRERPLEKQAAADAAHRRFAHPDSDFLTLLNIWDAYHDEFETMTQGKLRRFCHDHFLSYVRMREWRDIHAQLLDVLRERDGFKMTSVEDGLRENSKSQTPNAKLAWSTPAYRAIHRSILTGLLGNIALYDEEARLYKATHDRKVALFPGSVLFARDDPKKSRPDPGAPRAEKRGEESALDHGRRDRGDVAGLRPHLRAARSAMGARPGRPPREGQPQRAVLERRGRPRDGEAPHPALRAGDRRARRGLRLGRSGRGHGDFHPRRAGRRHDHVAVRLPRAQPAGAGKDRVHPDPHPRQRLPQPRRGDVPVLLRPAAAGEIRSKLGTRNSVPGTRNAKPGIGNSEPGIRKSKIQNRKCERREFRGRAGRPGARAPRDRAEVPFDGAGRPARPGDAGA